eukprot:TRINITY_DN10897_c0_g1_i1.p1 TRINITY_DN10897_c0_g1~~TRINITY_DN10897_c0_g1_i1.p1  ORF type:complete len:881 (-),score=241.11 TRINITY_DN10897_c0_g1_i1:58-2361(-)
MMGPGGVISTPTQGRLAAGGYPTPASPTSNVIPDVQITPQMQCSPTYMRVTMGCAPNNTTLMNKSGIPLGVIIHPLAKAADDDPIPVVNLAGGGIVRCRRCRSYINPFVAFSEGGRKWLCNLCGLPNDVHPEYYSPLDNLGRRTDLDQRPELQRGIVEFIASGEYTIRPPMPPSYMFVIDVSYQSVSSGVCYTVVETIKRLLDSFPGAPRTKIGFITYDSSVQFYNLKSSLNNPQVMVMSDLDEVFVPLPDDLLVNLADSKRVIEILLSKLATMYQHSQTTEAAMGVAVKAAYDIMNTVGGKVLLFTSTLPNKALGKLTNREDLAILGTDKETQLLGPAGEFYKDFALDCSRQHVTVDMYVCAPTFVDLATTSTMAQFTGGQLWYYPGFKAEKDSEALYRDIIRNITRETGWEGVMRTRTSKALKIVGHHGNFFIRSTDMLALPSIDADKSFAVQLGLNESSTTAKNATVQSALLYTTSKGERRIRVFTYCFPLTGNMSDLFNSADVETIAALTAKIAVEKALSSRLNDAREALVNKCLEILTTYKTDLAAPGPNTSLLLPETLKLFPLYILGLIKNVVFRGGKEVRPDERIYYMSMVRMAPTSLLMPFIYPRLFALHDWDATVGTVTEQNTLVMPPTLELSSEHLNRNGAYLLEDGTNMILYVGRGCPSQIVQDIFDIPSLEGYDTSQLRVQPLENEYSKRLITVIESLRAARPNFMSVMVVREGEPQREGNFFNYFVMDKNRTAHSYYEFLVTLHQRITTKISGK